MRRLTTMLLFSSLMLSILPAALGETPKADPARASIEKIGKDFADAYNRGDDKAVAAFYAEDAIVLPPESDMVKGRAAIQGVWKHALDTGIKSLEFNVADVVSSGNLAAETGTAVLHVQAMGSQESTVTVKYVVVWKKVGGSWKLYRDIWNSMAPPAAPATATTPAADHPHH